jgi:hypothetical protein
LEGEVRDALDRGYYERGVAPDQGYRNGHRTRHLKTAEGARRHRALEGVEEADELDRVQLENRGRSARRQFG